MFFRFAVHDHRLDLNPGYHMEDQVGCHPKIFWGRHCMLGKEKPFLFAAHVMNRIINWNKITGLVWSQIVRHTKQKNSINEFIQVAFQFVYNRWCTSLNQNTTEIWIYRSSICTDWIGSTFIKINTYFFLYIINDTMKNHSAHLKRHFYIWQSASDWRTRWCS